MIVRAITEDGDWTFGKGRNDYRAGLLAIAQVIDTRLKSFLGDCFFATNQGIDWWNLLGAKNQLALTLAISRTILNTPNVTGLLPLTLSLDDASRVLSVSYNVQTTLSQSIIGTFSYDFATAS